VVATAVALLDWARPLFVGVLAGGLVAAVSGALGTYAGLPMVRVAGVVVVLDTIGATMVPLLAFRLAGLRLAPLPTTAEHLQEDLDPVPSRQVLDRSASADRYMTGLYAGLAVPTAAGLAILGTAPGWAPSTLAGLAALTLTLSARPMTSAWHRISPLGAAATGVLAVAAYQTSVAGPYRLAVAAVGVPVVVLACLLIARFVPGRRMMPYWGRIGDLLYTLSAIALLPVLLVVLDVYARVRAIGG
jgi:type VII secretion integral membrane protein EccD